VGTGNNPVHTLPTPTSITLHHGPLQPTHLQSQRLAARAMTLAAPTAPAAAAQTRHLGAMHGRFELPRCRAPSSGAAAVRSAWPGPARHSLATWSPQGGKVVSHEHIANKAACAKQAVAHMFKMRPSAAASRVSRHAEHTCRGKSQFGVKSCHAFSARRPSVHQVGHVHVVPVVRCCDLHRSRLHTWL
jgi:hypothetical protein